MLRMMQKPTILVVDDNAMNREYLAEMLAGEYSILEASDGEAAVRMLEAYDGTIQMVLLDLMMPGLDGYGVLSWMNRHQMLPRIPVIVISAVTELEEIRRAYSMGAVEYFERPFDSEVISRRVDMVLRAVMELGDYKDRLSREQVYENLSRTVKFTYDARSHRVEISSMGARLLGLPGEIDNPLDDSRAMRLCERDDILSVADRLHSTSTEDPTVYAKVRLMVGGEWRHFQMTVRARWDDTKAPSRYAGCMGVLVDVDVFERQLQKWSRSAMIDDLTGILRGTYFEERVRERVRSHVDRHYLFALFDLDKFKLANDEHGHAFGDEVLRRTGANLRKAVREGDIICRMGGDEFMVFLEYTGDPRAVLTRLFGALREDYEGFEINLSMGASLSDDVGLDYDDLKAAADTAMYAAKQNGRGRFEIYDPEAMKDVLENT